MAAYYNENDPFCVAWLRELIKRGLIADGTVDDRSIVEVSGDDLKGFEQCHFFAGIGGWSYALRLAGWPDDHPVWTGSCPCQPFSAAGQRKGFDDSRHLWPQMFRLIRESKPERVFGEQVASALGWLDLVSGDLEGEGYSVGAAIVGAHSVGAAHQRQRIYFIAANSNQPGLSTRVFEQIGCNGKTKIPSAWSEFERVHAAQAWREWDAKSKVRVFADGISGRVGRLRGYGNAIVPQAAEAFISAYMEIM